jgi:glycine C-acetyltransferase/8-amino-7-oxononanoate synthase
MAERPIADELDGIRAAGLYRQLRRVDSAQGAELEVGGRRVWNFSSNDYLGLAGEPFIREAAAEAVRRFGFGAGASRLISGTLAPHETLEMAVAAFKGVEAAIAFSSGYAAAVGSIPALVGKGDWVVLDKLCHASLIDGARLSGATIRVFPHNHLEKLERLLEGFRAGSDAGADARRCLVVTESVFSMDGDRARLGAIVELAERFGAMTFVDEAHAVGVMGNHGRGLADELGVAGRVDVQMGTLSKALGGAGGYLCGRRELIELMINKARSFIYSTAPPPASAAAATAAVAFLERAEGEARRKRIWELIALFREGMGAHPISSDPPESAILPIIVGDEREAVAISGRLMDRGYWVPAIRYPTVGRGAARLRVTVTAALPERAVEGLCRELLACLPEGGAMAEAPESRR